MSTGLTTVVARTIDRIQPMGSGTVERGLSGDPAALAAWWCGEPVHDRTVVARDQADLEAGLEAGLEAADSAIDEGANLLVPRIHHRDPIAAMTAVGVLARREPQTLLPCDRPDTEWMRECALLRDAIAKASSHDDYLSLATHEIAFVAGVLLGAAARRTRCLIDGTDELAAALIASRLAFRAPSWWRAASTSADPARRAAMERIGLGYAVDLKTSGDDDIAIQSAIAVLRLL